MIKFKLAEFIEINHVASNPDEKLTRNMVAREAKVRPNVVYEMCDNVTKRVELKTLDKILSTLTRLTGKKISMADIVEYEYDE